MADISWIILCIIALCVVFSLWEFLHKRESHRKIHKHLVADEENHPGKNHGHH